MQSAEVIVIGGGMLGPAIAYGLARRGIDVMVLDEGDTALRAARGNFGLVWYHGKGLSRPAYSDWTRRSAELWPSFAAQLVDETGIDIAFEQKGGIDLCLGDAELAAKEEQIALFQEQSPQRYEASLLDRAEVAGLFPGLRLGDGVSGASFSPLDGLVNPLYLLRAMIAGLQTAGGRYLPGQRVVSIVRQGDDYLVTSETEGFTGHKVVLAAGHGLRGLGSQLGLDAPVKPERGQVLVTERCEPIFPLAMLSLRQNKEGTVMMGGSEEDCGYADDTTLTIMSRLARRAVACFPDLARLRLVRAWGALRVLTPDGYPIYQEAERYPGAYLLTCHSGVTLAAVHAGPGASWVAGDQAPPEFSDFRLGRFDVSATPHPH